MSSICKIDDLHRIEDDNAQRVRETVDTNAFDLGHQRGHIIVLFVIDHTDL